MKKILFLLLFVSGCCGQPTQTIQQPIKESVQTTPETQLEKDVRVIKDLEVFRAIGRIGSF